MRTYIIKQLKKNSRKKDSRKIPRPGYDERNPDKQFPVNANIKRKKSH